MVKSGRESQSRRAGGENEASSEWVRGGSRKGGRVEPGKAIDASRRGASEAAVGGVQGWPGEAIEAGRVRGACGGGVSRCAGRAAALTYDALAVRLR